MGALRPPPMSPTGLKLSVQLLTSTDGNRLVDAATARILELSALEAELVSLWDGGTTTAQLAAAARASGLDVEDEQVAVLMERLARAEFLATAPVSDVLTRPSPDSGQELAHVPALRRDLKFEKAAGAGGVMQVTDPRKGRGFTLYDFEVSIARLLDGRRSPEAVVASAGKIGIPVTPDGLRKFIRELRVYGFIDETARAPGEGPWPKRRAWSPEVRELYQSALRLSRKNKAEEALGYLDALLQLDPRNEEASQLRQHVEEQRVATHPEVDFEALHGSTPSAILREGGDPFSLFGAGGGAAPARRVAFTPDAGLPAVMPSKGRPALTPPRPPPAELADPFALFQAGQPIPPSPVPSPSSRATSSPLPSTGGVRAPTSPLPPITVVAPAPKSAEQVASLPSVIAAFAGSSADPAELDKPRPAPEPLPKPEPKPKPTLALKLPPRRVLMAGGAALLLLVVAIVLLRPVQTHVTLPAQVVPVVLGEPRALRAGQLAALQVEDGAEVKQGETIAILDSGALQARDVELGARLDAIHSRLTVLELFTRPNPAAAKARARVAKAQKGLDAVLAQKRKAKKARLPALERTERTKRAELLAAAKVYEGMTHDEERRRLSAEKSAVGRELATLEGLMASSLLSAPATGVFVAPPPPYEVGASLDAGDPWGLIVGPRLTVVAATPPDRARTGEAVLVVGGTRHPLQLRVADGGVEASLEGPPSLAGPSGTIEMPSGIRPWLFAD